MAAVANRALAAQKAHELKYATKSPDSVHAFLALRDACVTSAWRTTLWSTADANVSVEILGTQPMVVLTLLITDCLEGCTGELHTYYNEIYHTLEAFNSSASALLPWARINMIETQIPRLRVKIASPNTKSANSILFQGVLKASNMTAHRDVYNDINRLRQRARQVSTSVGAANYSKHVVTTHFIGCCCYGEQSRRSRGVGKTSRCYKK
jgi:hypothetical protein